MRSGARRLLPEVADYPGTALREAAQREDALGTNTQREDALGVGTQTDGAARFAALYRQAQPDVLAFVGRRLAAGDRNGMGITNSALGYAEDITHEVFLLAWQRQSQIPVDISDARAWLFTVARNLLLNDRRTALRRASIFVAIARNATVVVPGLADALETRIDLASAWSQLPAESQEVLALTAWDGLDSKQAAQVLGISAAAYRMRLTRARTALRKAMEPATVSRNHNQ